jgi:hypothetical protein
MDKPLITIMADYGGFAWIGEENEGRKVMGDCIADADSGFIDDITVSAELQRDLGEWSTYFETNTINNPEFDWQSFNARGLLLSQALFAEIGEQFKVVYQKPFEDPCL